VVREYVEPGVSGGSLLKRAAFRRMIEETAELLDVDLVIVWSVSRWARNQEDHWVARGLVTKAGAKLVSVKEPIGEETSHGILLEGVMAAAAAARRIEISEEVKRASNVRSRSVAPTDILLGLLPAAKRLIPGRLRRPRSLVHL
jgi:DNA invertase Pin-like site-specific DNA recombinase